MRFFDGSPVYQNIVSAGRCDFQCALRLPLAFDFRKIRFMTSVLPKHISDVKTDRVYGLALYGC